MHLDCNCRRHKCIFPTTVLVVWRICVFERKNCLFALRHAWKFTRSLVADCCSQWMKNFLIIVGCWPFELYAVWIYVDKMVFWKWKEKVLQWGFYQWQNYFEKYEKIFFNAILSKQITSNHNLLMMRIMTLLS